MFYICFIQNNCKYNNCVCVCVGDLQSFVYVSWEYIFTTFFFFLYFYYYYNKSSDKNAPCFRITLICWHSTLNIIMLYYLLSHVHVCVCLPKIFATLARTKFFVKDKNLQCHYWLNWIWLIIYWFGSEDDKAMSDLI